MKKFLKENGPKFSREIPEYILSGVGTKSNKLECAVKQRAIEMLGTSGRENLYFLLSDETIAREIAEAAHENFPHRKTPYVSNPGTCAPFPGAGIFSVRVGPNRGHHGSFKSNELFRRLGTIHYRKGEEENVAKIISENFINPEALESENKTRSLTHIIGKSFPKDIGDILIDMYSGVRLLCLENSNRSFRYMEKTYVVLKGIYEKQNSGKPISRRKFGRAVADLYSHTGEPTKRFFSYGYLEETPDGIILTKKGLARLEALREKFERSEE